MLVLPVCTKPWSLPIQAGVGRQPVLQGEGKLSPQGGERGSTAAAVGVFYMPEVSKVKTEG